jgi:putative tryptophan/tyrosine transport system substrate-binding protein
MKRRAFLQSIAVHGAAGMLAIRFAGARAAVRRIGVMLDNAASRLVDAFTHSMRERGWEDGRNVAIEWRPAAGRLELFPRFAEELLRLPVDVLVASVNPAILAAMKATRTVPIVTVYATSPIELGLVATLARPGGNITGLTWDPHPEIFAKILELLKDAAPGVSRVAVLVDATYPGADAYWKALQGVGEKLSVSLLHVDFQGAEGISGMFGTLLGLRADAVLPFFGTRLYAASAKINAIAQQNRLPVAWGYREGATTGGLFSYGPDLAENWRRAAYFVDRILRGARVGDLPVEQPSRFELIVNARTARALELALPPSLLVRADQIIE